MGLCRGSSDTKHNLRGAQWLWGVLRTWQQTLHTSAGLDLERGFKRGREGGREKENSKLL